MKYFLLILICAAINSLDDTNENYRKQYGLSFHMNCGNFFITFKCLTACKSMGFQVFRMDHKCKCTCHELKTTTVLPKFVWRTNGTTRKRPATFSPKLYAIVGTLSPLPTEKKEDEFDGTLPSCQPINDTKVGTDAMSDVTSPSKSNNAASDGATAAAGTGSTAAGAAAETTAAGAAAETTAA